MEKFSRLVGVAAVLTENNVNTDVLIRIDRLLQHSKGELGPFCFEAWRYNPDGSEKDDFILNRPLYKGCPILIAGTNFGCGSSREPAVWALWDMGIRCVIAPSFGDIFQGNCFQNGLLPIVLDPKTVAGLVSEAQCFNGHSKTPENFRIDLESQVISTPSNRAIAFEIEPLRRLALLEGLDEVMLTLRSERQIGEYQREGKSKHPWLYDVHLQIEKK